MSDQNVSRFKGNVSSLDQAAAGDEFARLLEETGKDEVAPLAAGERVQGRIVALGETSFLVDVGQRSEASVAREDFTAEELAAVKVGDVFEFHVRAADGAGIKLARAASARNMNLEELTEAMKANLPVEGRVTSENKGGFTVDLKGLRGFVPFSQIDYGPAKPATEYVGQTFRFKILEIRGKDVVLSRSAIVREEVERQRAQLLAELAEGQTRPATVVKVERFGVFVDLGAGIHALAPSFELGWGNQDEVKATLNVGDTVNVRVLKIDQEKGRPRVSVTMRFAEDDPWRGAAETLAVGRKVQGKVSRLAPFGAFVEVAPGIDGLLHISAIAADRRLNHPSDVLKVGQTIEVEVVAVDAGARRVSLSQKGPAEGAIDDETRAKYLGPSAKASADEGGETLMAQALKKALAKKR